MFCVIQKVQKKKPDPHGTRKELQVTFNNWSIGNNRHAVHYGYTYSDERFERPILDAYKMSIHQSYRENGKVKKKQYSIRTASYYDLLEFSLYDLADGSINAVATKVGVSAGEIYDLIDEKLEPLLEQIEQEFQQTEEYKVKKEQEAVLAAHRAAEAAFNKEYGQDEYKYCYDVFGILRNPDYLEELKARKKTQEEYTRRSYEESFKHTYSNYSGNSSSYYTASESNYTEEEKKILHEIYRMASKKFHPDVSGDDGSKMKFLTKLKEQWEL